MKRTIRLSEADLKRLIRRVIKEEGDKLPDPSKVLASLVGKRFSIRQKTMGGYGNNEPIGPPDVNFSIQVEGVGSYEEESRTGAPYMGVHLDVNLIDNSGKSIGGLYGTGKFNNLDIYCSCDKTLQVGFELVGSQNRSLNTRFWYSENLLREISNKYCRQLIGKVPGIEPQRNFGYPQG